MERLGRRGEGSTAGGGSGGRDFADVEGFREMSCGGDIRDDPPLVDNETRRFSVSFVAMLSTLI